MSGIGKLEATVTCVGLVRYLAFTYPLNRAVFDHYIVVTSESDLDTQAYCRENGITCVLMPTPHHLGAQFDYGPANNVGYKALKHHDWVAHLDVDTVLPVNFRDLLPTMDPEHIYGARRVVLERLSDYQDYQAGKRDFERPEGYGSGYFQMFNWQASAIQAKPYGEWCSPHWKGSESDWRFLDQWKSTPPWDKSGHRVSELPFDVLHLGAHGSDSQSRKLDTFFTSESRVRDNHSSWIGDNT